MRYFNLNDLFYNSKRFLLKNPVFRSGVLGDFERKGLLKIGFSLFLG